MPASEVNYSFGIALYMAPSNMLLPVGLVTGYNKLIVIPTGSQTLGLNRGLNLPDAPPDATNDTREKGLTDEKETPASDKPPDAEPPDTTVPPATARLPAATDLHEDEKTALIVGGIAVGLWCLLQ